MKLRTASYHVRRVLGKLCECKPGTGCLLDVADRRHATQLIRNDWAEWVQGGPLRVYMATKAGRQAWDEFTNKGDTQ